MIADASAPLEERITRWTLPAPAAGLALWSVCRVFAALGWRSEFVRFLGWLYLACALASLAALPWTLMAAGGAWWRGRGVRLAAAAAALNASCLLTARFGW